VSYDKLAERVRAELAGEHGVTEAEMFGGVAFLLRGNFFLGVSGRGALLVRVPRADVDRVLSRPHTERLMLAGRPRLGWVLIAPEAVRVRTKLAGWVNLAFAYAQGLHPKVPAESQTPVPEGRAPASTPTGRGPILDFDACAMWKALDSQRRERGLRWSGVATEIWELSAELNVRRPSDHPISPSTIRRLSQGGDSSCQHALFILRWLDKAPESFLGRAGAVPAAEPLPDCGPDRRLRWDVPRTYADLDAARRDCGITWSELARELRCTPSQLTGIRTARFAIGMGLAMRITQWLGRPAADFVYTAAW
jgi:hypothetical protein